MMMMMMMIMMMMMKYNTNMRHTCVALIRYIKDDGDDDDEV